MAATGRFTKATPESRIELASWCARVRCVLATVRCVLAVVRATTFTATHRT